MGTERGETWSSGEAYEPYVGRWSRAVAAELLGWLQLPSGLEWLDVGCGTGALSEAIIAGGRPRRLLAVDASDEYVAFARRRVGGAGAEVAVGDAQRLHMEDACVDAAVSGLMLNFVPDPLAAVREMARVVRPQGLVAAYVWDYADGMQMMRRFWDLAAAVDPAAVELDEGRRFPLCQPDRLADLFSEAGLTEVETTALVVPTVFPSFDDYWTPFLGGQGPAPSYVAALDADSREHLRQQLRAALPTGPDGTISLTARAWAVKGARPPA